MPPRSSPRVLAADGVGEQLIVDEVGESARWVLGWSRRPDEVSSDVLVDFAHRSGNSPSSVSLLVTHLESSASGAVTTGCGEVVGFVSDTTRSLGQALAQLLDGWSFDLGPG